MKDDRPTPAAGALLRPRQARALRAAAAAVRSHHGGIPAGALIDIANVLAPDLEVDVLASGLVGIPVAVLARRPEADSRWLRLSAREREVVRHVAAGLRNRDIARGLCLSEHTVKDHVHNALTKTGLRSRTQLARLLPQGASPRGQRE